MHQEGVNAMVTICVDGRSIRAEKGALLIDVLKQHGIAIPHFCYHEALGADGNCRMCMVELKGAKRPQIACDTFVTEGMEVNTQSEMIRKVRREILELELINHPVDCPVCDQAGECKLQDYYMEFGLYESRLDTPKTRKGKHIDLGSNVVLDQERCVLCARCTRFTQEITKTHELAIVGRGDAARVSTAPGRRLDNPYAMNVVDLCPVGALTSKDFRFRQRVWFLDTVPGICHGCARGCNIWVDHNRPKYETDRIYRYRPRINPAVNGHFLCDAGRLSYKLQNDLPESGICSYGSSVAESEALSLVHAALEGAKTIALADASLSLEQLAAIQAFCDRHKVALFAPGVIDDAFGDDWLRCSDRSANSASVTLLGIENSETAFREALKAASTVISFDHPLLQDAAETADVKVLHFNSRTFVCEAAAPLRLPFAGYALDEGSLINCDGRLQRFKRSLKQEPRHPTLLEWLHRIDADLPAHNGEVWERYLNPLPQLQGITYASVPADGIDLKGVPHA
jgi:NADH-quinone oxidoreductase subunit G